MSRLADGSTETLTTSTRLHKGYCGKGYSVKARFFFFLFRFLFYFLFFPRVLGFFAASRPPTLLGRSTIFRGANRPASTPSRQQSKW